MANVHEKLKMERRGDIKEIKRKKEVLERYINEKEREEGAFRKSRKVMRLPIKYEQGGYMKKLFRELREELREGLRKVKQEIREMAEEQREVMRKEVEKLKKDLKEKEECWNREREEMKRTIEKVEADMEKLKVEKLEEVKSGGEEKERMVKGARRRKMEWEERLKRLERRQEMKERDEKKRNIIIKGLEEGEEGIENSVRGLWEKIGVEGKE